MQPEVMAAIARLVQSNVIDGDRAALFRRVASRELVSIRAELRVTLYAGVLLTVSGVGLFLKEFHQRIGPAVIAVLLGAAVAACLGYVFRHAPAFSWEAVPSPHLTMDYILMLGLLLLGADLAYVESQFSALGAEWPYHLLLLSAVCLAAAYRFDSRAVLSVALTSFAAWRGLSSHYPLESAFGRTSAVLRTNALLCGVLFLAAAFVTVAHRWKEHFEPVWASAGLLLFFGGLLSGVYAGEQSSWLLWELALAATAAAVIGFAWARRRSLHFALGTIAAYLGLLRLLSRALGLATELYLLLVAALSLALLLLIFVVHRRMGEEK